MKKIKLLLLNIIIFIVFGSLLILESLCKFCVEQWDDLKLMTIVKQIELSITGTDKTLINTYFSEYFSRIAPIFVIVLAVFIFFNTFGKKIVAKYRIFGKYGEKRLYAKYSRNAIFLSIIVIPFLTYYANKLGIFTFIDNRINPSTIFEEYYINPAEVKMTFPEEKKNLILIYAESMEAGYASKEEGGAFDENLIPNLTKLAEDNINISRTEKLGGGFDTEGTSDFTAAALMASSGGVPFLSNTGNDANVYGGIMPGLMNLGDVLEKNGYHNYFQCGSNADFGSRRDLFTQHGNYTIYDYNYSLENGDIPEGYDNGFWGYEDEYLFSIAKDKLTRIASEGEPFNYTMLTVDSHFPAGYKCRLCKNEWSDYYSNSISCSDRQLYSFVEWLEKQEWIDNTTVVIIGDHTTMTEGFVSDGYDRVTYNCFIGLDDSVNTSKTKGRLYTTMDYYPTLLSSIDVQIDGDRLGLGTNLFSDRQTVIEEMGFDSYMNQINRFSKVYYKEIDMR